MAVISMLGGMESPQVQAAEGPWYYRGSAEGLLGNYSGSEERDDWRTLRLLWQADYLERASLFVGYEYSHIAFNPEFVGRGRHGRWSGNSVSQNLVNAGYTHNATPDAVGGRVGLRLDGYLLASEDEDGNSSSAWTIAPQVSWLSQSASWYFDLGYTYSSYADDPSAGDFEVSQLTPTVGVAAGGEGRNWLQLRGYFINSTKTVATIGTSNTTAIEAKFTRDSSEGGWLGMQRWRLGVLMGTRMFAVDPDVRTVYSLTDEQGTSAFAGVDWTLSESLYLITTFGTESYNNAESQDKYRSNYVSLVLGATW